MSLKKQELTVDEKLTVLSAFYTVYEEGATKKQDSQPAWIKTFDIDNVDFQTMIKAQLGQLQSDLSQKKWGAVSNYLTQIYQSDFQHWSDRAVFEDMLQMKMRQLWKLKVPEKLSSAEKSLLLKELLSVCSKKDTVLQYFQRQKLELQEGKTLLGNTITDHLLNNSDIKFLQQVKLRDLKRQQNNQKMLMFTGYAQGDKIRKGAFALFSIETTETPSRTFYFSNRPSIGELRGPTLQRGLNEMLQKNSNMTVAAALQELAEQQKYNDLLKRAFSPVAMHALVNEGTEASFNPPGLRDNSIGETKREEGWRTIKKDTMLWYLNRLYKDFYKEMMDIQKKLEGSSREEAETLNQQYHLLQFKFFEIAQTALQNVDPEAMSDSAVSDTLSSVWDERDRWVLAQQMRNIASLPSRKSAAQQRKTKHLGLPKAMPEPSLLMGQGVWTETQKSHFENYLKTLITQKSNVTFQCQALVYDQSKRTLTSQKVEQEDVEPIAYHIIQQSKQRRSGIKKQVACPELIVDVTFYVQEAPDKKYQAGACVVQNNNVAHIAFGIELLEKAGFKDIRVDGLKKVGTDQPDIEAQLKAWVIAKAKGLTPHVNTETELSAEYQEQWRMLCNNRDRLAAFQQDVEPYLQGKKIEDCLRAPSADIGSAYTK